MSKKILLSVFLVAISSQLVLAQCSRSGTFVQSDPTYFLSGSANVTFDSNGDKNVIFESDFESVQGADLRVYLSKTDDILTSGSDAIEITTSALLGDNGRTSPPQSPITGMKAFPISDALFPDIQIEDFDFIVIQCIAINERWGYANLGPEVGSDCSNASSVENTLSSNISFYPNPVKNNLEISNNSQLNLEITILDILGKKVLEINKAASIKQNINLSALATGTYYLQIKAGNNAMLEKFVKE
jgi:hypothetical protein